jgi:glycosyltransferase involved in cell wall biosynthesis
MTPRIAVVQHGDVREARRLREAGIAEPYYGMHYSQGFLDGWMAGRPHLVISLDAPPYREQQGDGLLVGLSSPPHHKPLPLTLTQLRWASQIGRELKLFQPTHFVLRTGTLLAACLLRLAVKQRWNTLAMFAGFFPNQRRYERIVTAEIVKKLNNPLVFAAGNHRQPATDSMIEAGLIPSKGIAWDYPPQREPADYPFKQLTPGPIKIVYAGSMIAAKGVSDVIAAVGKLIKEGREVQLVLCGEGPDLATFREQAAPLGNVATFLGRVGNDEVFRQMQEATLVCVPTHHRFPEGFPLTLTEGLTAHTPVLASDHPVFTRVLQEGEGLRFFPAGDAPALAKLVREVSGNATLYAELSRSTQRAYDALQCPIRFHEIIEKWNV